jgi:broad specificity phosphatase PhoE
MTALLLIRHAETTWNAEKRLQGRSDTPLSDKGRTMVRSWSVPEEFAHFKWLSSPLKRAVETANLLGHDPEIQPALIEMSWGTWEGENWQELQARLGPEVMAAHQADGLDFRPDDGESPREVQDRLSPWLMGLNTSTIAVCHKGILQAVYALASGWQMTEKPPVKFRHGSAYLFQVESGAPSVDRMNIPLGDS